MSEAVNNNKRQSGNNIGIIVLVAICFIALFVGGFSLGWSIQNNKKDTNDVPTTENSSTEATTDEAADVANQSETKDDNTVEKGKFADNVSYTTKATWEGGDNKYYQYVFNFKNIKDAKISNWVIQVEFSSDVTMDGNWNGKFEVSGNTVTITPVDYNKEVEAKGNVEDIGFTVYSENELEITSITFNDEK